MNLRNFRSMLRLVFRFFSTVVSLDDVKACLADQKGGLVLPIGGMAIEDNDWIRYKSLKVDTTVKSINPEDLPDDFCQKACKLVDEFRRKTVNEDVEWMLCFDYKTGDVIYCWEGKEGKCDGVIDKKHINGKNIATVHCHPKEVYSFPSPNNFEILEKNYEDYELITSRTAFWIVEFKGMIDKILRDDFQKELTYKINFIHNSVKLVYNKRDDINYYTEKFVGDYILNEIDKKMGGVDLIITKKEFFSMSENNVEESLDYISRCGGIPLYPNDSYWDNYCSDDLSDEEILRCNNEIRRFLKSKLD